MTQGEKIKWTDKVQAIAAIIAIVGGIAGFYKLFTTDIVIQTQIENSQKQTELLRQELTILSERNRILIEQLEIDKDKWNKQIMPNFRMDFSEWENWEGENNTFVVKGFDLVNTGGPTNIIKVIYNKENICKVEIPKVFVPQNGIIDFTLIYNNKKKTKIDLYLIFKDIENNYYKQRFISKLVDSEDFNNTDGMDNFKILDIVSEKPELMENYGL